MADTDTTLDASGATVTYATDDISSVKYPRVKVTAGVDGTARRDLAFECSMYHLVAANSTNAVNIKASAGHVTHVQCSNINAAIRYLKFHNTAGTPTAGSGVVYTVLVPNLRGAERAMATHADELNLVMSTSETHNLANLRQTREDSFAGLASVIQWVDGKAPINVSLSTSFGCPMEGDVPRSEVMRFAHRFADLGVRGLTICDTTGMAHPTQVEAMAEAMRQAFPQLQMTFHFHNTRGMGLANVMAAARAGIDRFDGSLGGLGGCPYAPGASGNISSEDAIHLLMCLGYETGIDLDRLVDAGVFISEALGRQTSSRVARALLSKRAG